jgi:hypothetical protein
MVLAVMTIAAAALLKPMARKPSAPKAQRQQKPITGEPRPAGNQGSRGL